MQFCRARLSPWRVHGERSQRPRHVAASEEVPTVGCRSVRPFAQLRSGGGGRHIALCLRGPPRNCDPGQLIGLAVAPMPVARRRAVPMGTARPLACGVASRTIRVLCGPWAAARAGAAAARRARWCLVPGWGGRAVRGAAVRLGAVRCLVHGAATEMGWVRAGSCRFPLVRIAIILASWQDAACRIAALWLCTPPPAPRPTSHKHSPSASRQFGVLGLMGASKGSCAGSQFAQERASWWH